MKQVYSFRLCEKLMKLVRKLKLKEAELVEDMFTREIVDKLKNEEYINELLKPKKKERV